MDKRTEKQKNCQKHHFKHEGGAIIICQKCGIDIIDLIDGLYEETVQLKNKLEQQEKYAELGRSALEFLADKDYCSDACAISAFKDGVSDNCKECWVFKICQKRAELLTK